MIAALRFGGRGWIIGALAFNAWSVIDAVWLSRRSGVETADDLR